MIAVHNSFLPWSCELFSFAVVNSALFEAQMKKSAVISTSMLAFTFSPYSNILILIYLQIYKNYSAAIVKRYS